jgi:hypothetical protein
MIDRGDALLRPWVGYQGHFPPLLPLFLAVTGGAYRLATAHAVVAAFAVLAMVAMYRYGARLLGSNTASVLVTALFMLTPTAWIAVSGILSETLFLFVTLCALHYHETQLADADAPPRRWLIFGVLLGACLLTRTAGILLVVAYVLHVATAAWRARTLRVSWLLPCVPVAAMLAIWLLWRPATAGYNYASALSSVMDLAVADPAGFIASCAQIAWRGWMRTFAGDSGIHWLPQAVFAAVGLLGLAGSLSRARGNHLDGWYVLVALPAVSLWLFSEDNNRRLMYPVVPLLLIHAAMGVQHASRRIRSDVVRRVFAGAAVALPVLLCLPAFVTVQSRARDHERIYPGLAYRYSDMTEYYTTLDTQVARALAAKHAGVLAGLESLRTTTPPGARVMWVRPDYVAVLGQRDGVPLFQAATRGEFVDRLARSRADYIFVSSLLKADMDADSSSPQQRFNWALETSQVVHAVPSRVSEEYEAIVLRVARP